MTYKTVCLMGVRLLTDVNYLDGYRLNNEEKEAIRKTIDILSRFYTHECITDIDGGTALDGSKLLDVFCDEHIDRIKIYTDAAGNAIKKYIAER